MQTFLFLEILQASSEVLDHRVRAETEFFIQGKKGKEIIGKKH